MKSSIPPTFSFFFLKISKKAIFYVFVMKMFFLFKSRKLYFWGVKELSLRLVDRLIVHHTSYIVHRSLLA